MCCFQRAWIGARADAGQQLILALLAVLAARELPRGGVQQLAPGEILIATAKSHDPMLARSVVLLIHCDGENAMGLMVNRPNGDIYLLPGMSKSGRVFVGYTGWSAQQLKDEIARGLWKVHAPDSRLVFDPDPATLWTRLIR